MVFTGTGTQEIDGVGQIPGFLLKPHGTGYPAQFCFAAGELELLGYLALLIEIAGKQQPVGRAIGVVDTTQFHVAPGGDGLEIGPAKIGIEGGGDTLGFNTGWLLFVGKGRPEIRILTEVVLQHITFRRPGIGITGGE